MKKQKAAAAPSKQFLVQNPAETQAATISQASSEVGNGVILSIKIFRRARLK